MMTESVAAILKSAAALIDATELCQRELALDNDGAMVYPCDPTAISYCGHGAVIAVTVPPTTITSVEYLMNRDAVDALTAYAKELGYTNYLTYNDEPGRTKQEVIAFITDALDFQPDLCYNDCTEVK